MMAPYYVFTSLNIKNYENILQEALRVFLKRVESKLYQNTNGRL